MVSEAAQKRIEEFAYGLGFSLFGVSQAGFLEQEAHFLTQWLNENKHGEMDWLANHFDMRVDPTLLVPGAKSVISLGFEYLPAIPMPADGYKISKYAYGKDYHKVIKKKLHELLHFMQHEIGQVSGRAFVDSAPVMEKVWAAKSGLGWVGKNTLLLNKTKGSFLFLSELIVDVALAPTSPVKDLCKTCNLCVEACPTGALDQPYQLDAKKCISYLTIELKNQIPQKFQGQMNDWIFGCDICQDVCPWTRNASPTNDVQLNRYVGWKDFNKKDWEELEEEAFKVVFAGTPVNRTKYKGLKRNILFASGLNK